MQSLLRWLRDDLRLRDPKRLAALATFATVSSFLTSMIRHQHRSISVVPLSTLFKQVEAGLVQAAVVSASCCAFRLRSSSAHGSVYRANILPGDTRYLMKLLHQHGVEFSAQGPAGWRSALVLMLPFAYLGLCGWLLYKMSNGDLGVPGQNSDSVSSVNTTEHSINFDDVGGMPQIKAQVMEVVDFYHHPERYARLGARRPRGVLLAGPPGTGKTLLARAVAGTVGVPFLSCAGSDFVEVFVGRGARRVRALFEEAALRAPCVLFIDELDALGGCRSNSPSGSEEHEHTLNQLLALMDGIGSDTAVLVIGATNRLSALDPALTRPGRFDRVLQLPLPDEVGRQQILQVHTRRTPLHEREALIAEVASTTDGLSGAELANLVNEAAICAVRKHGSSVTSTDFSEALADYRRLRSTDRSTDRSAPSTEWSTSLAALLHSLQGHNHADSIDDND